MCGHVRLAVVMPLKASDILVAGRQRRVGQVKLAALLAVTVS